MGSFDSAAKKPARAQDDSRKKFRDEEVICGEQCSFTF
jgi:hypothetical protein